MKRYVFVLLALIMPILLCAQLEVKEGSFKEVQGFVNINTEKLYDDNDKPYAVLKIKTENINSKQRRELSFGGDAQTFFEVEYKDGEVWLYISYYATFIKISHEELSSTEFYFPYDMEPKKGYELTLANKASNNTGIGAIIITTKPDNDAIITLNGKVLSQKTPYINDMIASGFYEIIVSKTGFESVTKTVNICDGAIDTIDIEMPYLYGTINVESRPVGASVYIDDEERGITPLTLNIIYGTHELKVKKDDYTVYKERFFVNDQSLLGFNVILNHYPDGAVHGIFSVSDSTRVFFSMGNLQYQPKSNSWRFAKNQWMIIGEANERNIRNHNKGWIDLYGWGSSGYNDKMPYDVGAADINCANGGENISGTDYDWGVYNTISNGGNSNWRTLTKDEWDYVFNKRTTNSGIRFAMATVNGVYGVIILPDNWNSENYILNNTNPKSFTTKYGTGNIVSLSDWLDKLESNGAVFLPAAGYRLDGKTWVTDVNDYCCYWSSTKASYNGAYHLAVNKNYIMIDAWAGCSEGMSVRLVCDVE